METVADDTQKESPENATAGTSSPVKATTPAPAKPVPQPDPPKKVKREDRNRKEDEYVKQFTKALNAAPDVEEKMQIAIQKYTHMVDDNKKMQFYMKQSEKRHNIIMKEKDQLQSEFNKTVLVKSKLENLCRELQKQNKTIKEESLLKIREEEERRKETQAKFQNTLTEITTLLQQNNEKNSKLRDDNISMAEKFSSVAKQCQIREEQIDKMAKQLALEEQLNNAKMSKASLEHQAEQGRMLAELEGHKATMQQYRARVMELQATEHGLRSQLAIYTDKYDEFQNALVKSNQVFGGFKEEMEKMSKKIKKLEKESLSWKKRWETSQAALVEMCTERHAAAEHAAAGARQLHNLQGLCRTLQAERTVLLGTLKENNIERPPLPAPVPAPPPPAPAPPASSAKVDAMAANCAQLRQSLAHLQSQLTGLTKPQSPAAVEEPAKPEKPKKKSKKSKKQEARKVSETDANAKESATESTSEDKVKVEANAEEAESSDKKTNQTQAIEGEVEAVLDKAKAIADKVEAGGKIEKKLDDKTLESLIQAINNTKINLSNLEVVGDNKIDIDDVLDVDSQDDEFTKSTDTASDYVTEIDSSNKGSSSEDSPKNQPKIVEIIEEIRNGVKIVTVTERIDEKAQVADLIEKITNMPKIVELTEEIANRPKIVELTEEIVNKPKIVELTEEIASRPKIVELTEEIANRPKIVELVDEIANGPKIVELTEKTGNTPKIVELANETRPKTVKLQDEIANGPNLVVDTETPPKLVELSEAADSSKIVEVTEQVAHSPKIVTEETPTQTIDEKPEVITNMAIPEPLNIGIPKEIKQVANAEIKAIVDAKTAQHKLRK